MGTTSWETMRQEIVRPFGLVTGTTTTNVAANTSLIDTGLTDLYSADDYFNGNWFAIVTSNNRDGQYRRITDYAQSSGTLTVSKAWGAGTDGADSTYELMPVPPNNVMRAYNRARQIVWPQIGIVRDVETLVTGNRQFTYEIPSTIRKVNRIYLGERYEAQTDAENLLVNGSFENWTNATTADNWSVTGSGSPSVNQEEQTSSPTNYAVLSGNNSARLIVPASSGTVTTLVQTFNSASSDYTAVATQGMEANVSAWVYCTVASRVSLTIDGTVQSETHGGTGWELLKGSKILTQDDTATVVGISVTSGAILAVYVDEVFLTLGQSEALDRPYTPITNWDIVPPAAGASTGGTLRFTGNLPSHHRLRIVGTDLLSSVSSDTSTVEIDGELLEPLYNKVRQMIADEMSMGIPDSYWFTMARQYEAEYNKAIESGAVGLRVPRPRFKAPSMAY